MRLAIKTTLPAAVLGGSGGALLAGTAYDDEGLALIIVATAGFVLTVGLRRLGVLEASLHQHDRRIRTDLRMQDRRAAAAIETLDDLHLVVKDLVRAELEQVGLLEQAVERPRVYGPWIAPFN